MRTTVRMIATAVLTLAAGCATQGPKEAGLQGSWTLVELGDLQLHGGIEPPTLLVADEQVSGFAGVNRFTGQLADEGGFLFGPLASTRMAGPPPAMELETRYLSALQQATAWRVEEGSLVLTSDGDAVAVFAPAE